MKTPNSKTASQKLADLVEMARLRVRTAESRWQAAKEQARVAKRRRKEVKLIARRARKQAKQAKADLAEARKALAEAEVKLAKSGACVATKKRAKAKARPVAKGVVPAQAGSVIGKAAGGTPQPAVIAGAPAAAATGTTSIQESSSAAK